MHRTLRRPMTSHHCDSHVSSAEDSTSGGEESTTMDGGMHPAPPKLACVSDTRSHVNMHAGASRDDPRRSSRTAAQSVNKLAALAAEEDSRAAWAAKAAEDELRANTMTRLVDSLKGLLDSMSEEQKSSISGMLLSGLGGVESKKRRGAGGGGRVASPATVTVAKVKASKKLEADDAPSATKAAIKARASKTTEGVKEDRDRDTSEAEHVWPDQRPADPHLQRDTTGMFRTTFLYDRETRTFTQDWMEKYCDESYYRPVMNMWMSGKYEWTRGKPPPNATTLNNWRRARLKEKPQVEVPVVARKVLLEGATLSIQLQQQKKGATLDVRTLHQTFMKALELSMDVGSLFIHLRDSDGLDKHYFNLMVASKSINVAVSRTHFGEAFMVAARLAADYRMLMAEYQFSQRLANPAEQAEQDQYYQSQRQIPVRFPNRSDRQRKELESVIGQDLIASMCNLGDGMPFLNSFDFISRGTYGAVFKATDSYGVESAWKVLTEARPLDSVTALACNEFTANLSSQTVRRVGRATRNAHLPFAVGTIEMPGHPMHTKSCFAMPSKGKPGIFYAVLVNQLALGSLEGEVKKISSELFSDRSGKAAPGALSRAASLFACAVQAVSNLHAFGFAHRDIKWSNMLMVPFNKEVPGPPPTTTNGVKVQIYASDFGMALSPNIKTFFTRSLSFEPGTGRANQGTGRARQGRQQRAELVLQRNAGVALSGNEVQRAKQETQMKLKDQSVLPARLKLKDIGVQDAPALFEINIRSLQLLTGCFPSHAKEGDPPPPPQYACGWGTPSYAPRESNPEKARGSAFAQARSYQAGDVWALGAMLTEIVKGRGLKVAYQPDDAHGKELFATCSSVVFWRMHLNKTGDAVPEEWEQCVDLIRNLCSLEPADRLSATDALQHEFLRPPPRD